MTKSMFPLLVFSFLVPALIADETRDRFLARRAQHTAALAAQRGGPLATVYQVLTIISSKHWADSSGNYVLVGEVRNTGTATLTSPRINFTFMNGATVVGSDYQYIDGGMSARVGSSSYLSDILRPNEVGFFKLYTSIKAATITDFTYTSEANAVSSYTPALANPVLLGSFSIEAATLPDVEGTIKNAGTATAYLVQIHMAGYLNGSINDYDYAFARGIGSTCDSSADDGIPQGSIGTFRDFSSRQIDSIGRYAITWYECPASTDPALDISLNKYEFVNGDSVSATSLRIRNPDSKSRAVEIKLFLAYPDSDPISMLNIGSDGSFKLPPAFNENIGSLTLMTVSAGMARGSYEFSSRIIDPVTGKLISENVNPFVVK